MSSEEWHASIDRSSTPPANGDAADVVTLRDDVLAPIDDGLGDIPAPPLNKQLQTFNDLSHEPYAPQPIFEQTPTLADQRIQKPSSQQATEQTTATRAGTAAQSEVNRA